VQYQGDKLVVFDPSPDERVTGYIIYFDDGEVEYNTESSSLNTSGKWQSGTEYQLEEGRLHPGKTYTITAVSHDEAGNMSARSEALVVTVAVEPLPDSNMMPLYEPVSGVETLNIIGI
jgi:hypothetical protein